MTDEERDAELLKQGLRLVRYPMPGRDCPYPSNCEKTRVCFTGMCPGGHTEPIEQEKPADAAPDA